MLSVRNSVNFGVLSHRMSWTGTKMNSLQIKTAEHLFFLSFRVNWTDDVKQADWYAVVIAARLVSRRYRGEVLWRTRCVVSRSEQCQQQQQQQQCQNRSRYRQLARLILLKRLTLILS